MIFPPELQIYGVQPGQVYLMRHSKYPEKEHFFVVANFFPEKDNEHIIVCCTSQVDKAKAYCKLLKLPQETVVELAPSDYIHLSMNTAINCSNAELMPKQELVEKLKNGHLEIKTPVSQDILDKIRRGILSCRLVSFGIRNKLAVSVSENS